LDWLVMAHDIEQSAGTVFSSQQNSSNLLEESILCQLMFDGVDK
jgi:hypothetical protein